MREFWEQEGFIEIKSPKLLGIPSEGGAEAFEMEYFGKKAYLAQSPQFYKQMAMAAGFEKIFEIGPVFRAEKSFTYRHATEFTGIEMEISFVSGLEDLIKLQERWLVYWIEKVKERWGKEILETFGREVVVPETPFPQLSVAEVKKILGTTGSSVGTEEETQIGKYVLEKYKHEFVFITKWPWESRPFYHKKIAGQEFSESFDLLWGGLETTTCAVREHRYAVLLKQVKEKGLTVKNFEPFLRFFKYGCPPHGGMGLGMERLLLRLLGLKNIREVAFVARDPKRLTP